MSGILKRAAWLSLAILFVVTGLGVGIVTFWQATHPPKENSQSQSMTCINDPSIQFNATPKKDKLTGSKLANFTPLAQIASLNCIDTKIGDGGQVVSSTSVISVHYTGAAAATGVIFQSSLDSGQPYSTSLSDLIPGWRQGLLGMKAGGERRLLVPSALAYGTAGSCQTLDPNDNTKCAQYSILPNTDLVFDISIVAVQ